MSVSQERPAYFQRIDSALENGGKIANAIEALAAEEKANKLESEVQELVRILRAGATTEQFVNDGAKAAWLPFIIRARPGVVSSNLSKMFCDLAFENEVLRSKRLQLVYPLLVLVIAIVLFVVMAHTIIPTYDKMFLEFNLKLPYFTKLLIGIGRTIQLKPLMSCFWLVGLTLAAIAIRKVSSPLLRHLELTTFIGPLVSGNSESVRAMGRFTSTLAELLDVGAPISEAILIAGRASQNLRFISTSKILAKEYDSSEPVMLTPSVSQNFPELVFHALVAGPNKTPSIPLLRQISTIYFERVRHRMKRSESNAGPLLMICIGLLVGIIVVALFLPLVSLISSLSG